MNVYKRRAALGWGISWLPAFTLVSNDLLAWPAIFLIFSELRTLLFGAPGEIVWQRLTIPPVVTTLTFHILGGYDRRINVGDQLSFRIVEDKEQPVGLIVSDSGQVEVPLRAGGFSDFANRRKVKVLRKTRSGEKVYLVDVKQVLDKARGDLDFTVKPGDVIRVPARLINW